MSLNKDLHMEVPIDMDNFIYQLSRQGETDTIQKFVIALLDECGDQDVDELVFLGVLKHMISQIALCPEDYAGTKWEMLLAMQGLLDK